MIATLVLFNGFFALWAVFRVSHDPVDVFGLVGVFEQPIFTRFASCWSMGFPAAFPAKRVPAFAHHVVDSNVIFKLNAVVATLLWAPPHRFIVVCERFIMVLVVHPQICSRGI